MFYPIMTSAGISGAYASAEATAAQNTAREAQASTELLSHDVERLLLITQALWTLMKQQQGYADDVLTNLIEEIERRKTIGDGAAVKDPPRNCPHCGRPNSANRLYCIYCGQAIGGNPFAR